MIGFKDNSKQELLAAAQTITDTWADVGEAIDVRDVSSLGLWVDLDVNNSQDVRLRLVALPSPDSADIYELPLEAVAATESKIQDHYFELDNDADQKMLLKVSVSDVALYVKVQVMAGTVGGTPGRILSLGITAS